jgi:hypothetical protein
VSELHQIANIIESDLNQSLKKADTANQSAPTASALISNLKLSLDAVDFPQGNSGNDADTDKPKTSKSGHKDDANILGFSDSGGEDDDDDVYSKQFVRKSSSSSPPTTNKNQSPSTTYKTITAPAKKTSKQLEMDEDAFIFTSTALQVSDSNTDDDVASWRKELEQRLNPSTQPRTPTSASTNDAQTNSS